MPQVDEFGRAIPSVGEDAAAENNDSSHYGRGNNYRDLDSRGGGGYNSNSRPDDRFRDQQDPRDRPLSSSRGGGRYGNHESNNPYRNNNNNYNQGGNADQQSPYDRPLSASRDGPSHHHHGGHRDHRDRDHHHHRNNWRSNSPTPRGDRGGRPGSGRRGGGGRGGDYHHHHNSDGHHNHHHGGGSHHGHHHGGSGTSSSSAPPHPSQRYVTEPMLCEFLWKEDQEKKSGDNPESGKEGGGADDDAENRNEEDRDNNTDDNAGGDGQAADNESNENNDASSGKDTYDQYRLNYAWTFLKHFFNQHLDDSWFRKQYSPALLVEQATLERKRCHAEARLLRLAFSNGGRSLSEDEIMSGFSLTVEKNADASSNNANSGSTPGSFISMTQQQPLPKAPSLHLCDTYERALHIHNVPSHVNDEHLKQTLLPLMTDYYTAEQEKLKNSKPNAGGGSKKKKANYSQQEVLENCLLGLFSSTPNNSNKREQSGIAGVGATSSSSSPPPPRRGGSSVFLHRSVFCVLTSKECCDSLWQLLIQRTANPEDPQQHPQDDQQQQQQQHNNNSGNPNEGGSSNSGPGDKGAHVPRKHETAHLNSAFHDLEVDCTDPYGRTEYDANGQGGAPPDGLAIPPRKAVLSISRFQVPVHNAITLSAALSSPGRFAGDLEAATTMARALDVRQHVPMEDRLDSILEQNASLLSKISPNGDENTNTNEDGGVTDAERKPNHLVLDITLAYLRRVHLYSFYKTAKAETFGDILAGTSVAAQVQLREQVDPEFNEADKEDLLGQRLDDSIRQALEVDCNEWIAAADYYVDETTDNANDEIQDQEAQATEDWIANHSMDDDGRARCSFHFCHKLFKDESFLRKHLLKKHDAYNQAERAKCHDNYMMSIWEKAPLRPGVPCVLVDCGKQFGKVDSLLSGGAEPRAMDPEPALWERKQQQDKLRMERSELRASRHRPEFDRKKEQQKDGPPSSQDGMSSSGPPPTSMTPRSGGGGRSFVDVDDMKEETVEVSFEQVQLPVADAAKKKKKKKRKLL